jgi:hypothetical protein
VRVENIVTTQDTNTGPLAGFRAQCHPELSGVVGKMSSVIVSVQGVGWRAKDLFTPNLVHAHFPPATLLSKPEEMTP